jgi:hypothetical protein
MEGAMPQTDQLTALKVSRAKPKRRPDGTLIGYRLPDKKQTGLYLAVSATGAKSWVYMWERNGKRRVMGLGSEKALSLANAREDAAEAYRDVRKGLDPIAERNKRKGHSITFAEAAAACLKAKGVNWSAKHQRNFMPLLETHAKPLLTKAVNQITRDDVERVVRPIWTDKRKHDIASRLRGRIERVLDWAKANDHRTGENPAAWKGNLKHRLPEFERHVKHMAALRYKQIPEFMARLRMVDTRQARLLEFTILTAARRGETRGATWDEIDFDAKLWTIPESRMKAGPHQVPLSERAGSSRPNTPSSHRPTSLPVTRTADRSATLPCSRC